MKRRHYFLMAALALVSGLILFDDGTNADLVEPVERALPKVSAAVKRPTPGHGTSRETGMQEPSILVLRARDELRGSEPRVNGQSDLFVAHSWTPLPPPEKPVQAPPPMAPPLPFIYLGKKSENGKWEAYLGRGDQTFIVQEHSIVEHHYRVEAITPPNLMLTYLPLNQSQTLAIGGLD